jgi:hypothetical protein
LPDQRQRDSHRRPDVTNSSLVVPYGSLQAENGVDWTVSHGSNALDGTNTRLRLGIAPCTEFLIDVPNYFFSINGPGGSGFGDLVVSFKRQLPVPFGFELSATGGLGFPSGSGRISGHGYEPYIQFPWSHEIAKGWEAVGMFTLTWFPSESRRNPTFEPTLSLERAFGPSADMFLEYVGDYDHHSSSTFTSASVSTVVRSIIISASGIRSASTGYSGIRLDIHRDLSSLAKILAVALDVLAVWVGIGIA